MNSLVQIFQQVVNFFLSDIRDGKILKGDKLPSVNSVTAKLKIAPGTVTKAYNELKKMGIAESSQGKSYYVVNNAIGKINIFVLVDRLTHYKSFYENRNCT